MARKQSAEEVEPVTVGGGDQPGEAPGPVVARPLRELTKVELIRLVEQLSAFGAVEAAVRAALDGVPPGGVGAARAALAVSLAQKLDDPPASAKLSELASASKEIRAVMNELDLERGDDRGSFFDDLDDEEG